MKLIIIAILILVLCNWIGPLVEEETEEKKHVKNVKDEFEKIRRTWKRAPIDPSKIKDH